MSAKIRRIHPEVQTAPSLTRRELRNGAAQWSEASARRNRRSYDSAPVTPPLISARKESVFIGFFVVIAVMLFGARLLGLV